MQTPIDMTRSTDHIRAEREARDRDAARAHQAAAAELAVKAEATARFDAQARALPESLFDDEPEIKALRSDHEVKRRQRPILSTANPELLFRVAEGLRERIKARTMDAMIAAIEDVMSGDPTLRRAMVIQDQVDEDERQLALLGKAGERLNRFGFSAVAREREQLAGQALEAALLDRKRRYLAEHPELTAAPITAPMPAAAPASAVVATFAAEDIDEGDSTFPTYAMPATLRSTEPAQQQRNKAQQDAAAVAAAEDDVAEV